MSRRERFGTAGKLFFGVSTAEDAQELKTGGQKNYSTQGPRATTSGGGMRQKLTGGYEGLSEGVSQSEEISPSEFFEKMLQLENNPTPQLVQEAKRRRKSIEIRSWMSLIAGNKDLQGLFNAFKAAYKKGHYQRSSVLFSRLSVKVKKAKQVAELEKQPERTVTGLYFPR
ncbi:MAG: hypothetical protein K0U12_01260 [Gammaproteobacteria bacterium]|nr:hypothetical protein [Gammaproteobacteria bacterium]